MSDPAPSTPPDPAPPAPTPPAPTPAPAGPQAGIRNRPPEHVIVAAFNLPADAASAQTTIKALRDLETAELHSRLPTQDATTDPTKLSPETGEIGFKDGFDRQHLTITTGFGSTAFTKLGVEADLVPQDLRPIDWALLGDSPTRTADQGDIVVQICSDDPYLCEHVLHRVSYEIAALTLVWVQVGVQRYTSRVGRVSRSEGRAINGFVDGTANLNPGGCPAGDEDLIFVDPDQVATYPPVPANPTPNQYGPNTAPTFPPGLHNPPTFEPPWTMWGSYMAVRAGLLDFTKWDPATLGAQQETIGRFKFSGAFLDVGDDPAKLDDPPVFATAQSNTTVPPTSHVRKANPHGPGDELRRFLRRGYPIIESGDGGLDRGLLFIAFGRTISTQFEFVFVGWMRNPNFPTAGAGPDALLGFEKAVLAGGYFFVPPLTDLCNPASWTLPGLDPA
jgi:deferrochelatase/peroxidase EfeB